MIGFRGEVSRALLQAGLVVLLAGFALQAFAGAALAESSGAWAWGSNGEGQLGIGRGPRQNEFQSRYDVPVAVEGLSEAKAISSQGQDSLALLENGTVLAWGANSHEQLGNGGEHASDVPVPVGGLSGVTAVSAGDTHSLALLENGTVMAWGDNQYGELGDGTTTDSHVPLQVVGLSGVTAIAVGHNYSLALLENGTVMAWGDNESGELGTGSEGSFSDVPVQVKGLSEVAAISAGEWFSLALLKNGTVKSWGVGALGDGSEGESQFSDVPVPVCAVGETAPCAHELSGVTSISADWSHSLGLLSNGTVVAWGWNGQGELGDGQEEFRSADTPVAVSNLSEVTAISAGNWHSLALLKSGTVKAWGEDLHGQLGDGESGFYSDDRDVPVEVKGLSGVTVIAASEEDSLALTEQAAPIPTIAKVEPNHGPIHGGTQVTITGSNFTGATEVTFGEEHAMSYSVNSDTSITAVAPAGTPGTVDVGVGSTDAVSVFGSADDFTYAAPAIESESESNITEHGVTLEALINPDGFETEYELWLECASQCEPPQRVGQGHIAAGHLGNAVSLELGDLEPSRSYKYWVVATDAEGRTTGRVLNFTAGQPPRGPVTETGGASGLTNSEAKLEGKINPEGENAGYFFEYGTSTAYGQTAPIPPGRIENGACGLICEIETPQPVSSKLTELEPGTVYHYRLVATSDPGYRRYGKDATFTTAGTKPPGDEHARPLGNEEASPNGGEIQSSGGSQSGTGSPTLSLAVPLIGPSSHPPRKVLSRVEKLAMALRACKKDKSKRKRAVCARRARKKYAPARKRKR